MKWAETTRTLVSTPWSGVIGSQPASVLVRDNYQLFAMNPWRNVQPSDAGTPPINENLPVADAGADASYVEGDLVVLDGSDSYSPGAANPISYQWTLLNKPGVNI